MAGEMILVVDDNDVNCLVADSMLKILGYKTFVAKSGAEAVDFASKTKFDLILMDWQMPEMNGFDTATAIWGSVGKLVSELNFSSTNRFPQQHFL